MDPKYSEFVNNLRHAGIDGARIYTDPMRTLAWGTDASFYRLVPKVVVHVRDAKEMQSVLRTASSMRLPVTFRAAGTSLSGQSLSDSVLVVAGKDWEGFRILDKEAREIPPARY